MLPKTGGAYSSWTRAGNLVFLAGQIPVDQSGKVVIGSFDDQARQALANLSAVAKAAGGSLRNAVRVGIYLRDMSNRASMDIVYREFFDEPFPARTTVQSNLPGFEVEVDAILAFDRR